MDFIAATSRLPNLPRNLPPARGIPCAWQASPDDWPSTSPSIVHGSGLGYVGMMGEISIQSKIPMIRRDLKPKIYGILWGISPLQNTFGSWMMWFFT